MCIFLLEMIPFFVPLHPKDYFSPSACILLKWFVIPVALTAMSFYNERLALIVC